tara:strand:+ start:133 stop:546 length:414 start_codon:yes stop_codon:yes gene_type:complete
MQGGDDEFLRRALKNPHWNICKTLMNQNVVAGIGNYIKAETLYALKISPWCTVGDLSESDLKEVFKAAGDIAWRAHELGGATIQSYKDPNGKSGGATQIFSAYGQKMSPNGNEVLREETPDKRTTHWVPNEQIRFAC